MAKILTPQTIDALINQALAIEDEQAQDAGALGFMARAMVQATLPHCHTGQSLVTSLSAGMATSH